MWILCIIFGGKSKSLRCLKWFELWNLSKKDLKFDFLFLETSLKYITKINGEEIITEIMDTAERVCVFLILLFLSRKVNKSFP